MKINLGNAEHYLWGESCQGWHLLKRPELSVIAEQVPPGATEQRHFHRTACQFFYVLQGVASIEMDGKLFTLAAGDGLEVPPGSGHRFFNDGEETVHFLVISNPPSHGDRVDSPL